MSLPQRRTQWSLRTSRVTVLAIRQVVHIVLVQSSKLVAVPATWAIIVRLAAPFRDNELVSFDTTHRHCSFLRLAWRQMLRGY